MRMAIAPEHANTDPQLGDSEVGKAPERSVVAQLQVYEATVSCIEVLPCQAHNTAGEAPSPQGPNLWKAWDVERGQREQAERALEQVKQQSPQPSPTLLAIHRCS